MSTNTAPQIIYKQPSEAFPIYMDFEARLDTGETIETAEITAEPSDIIVGSETIDGAKVYFWVSEGVAGFNYRINVVVTTSLNKILEGDGILKVRNS